MINLRRTDIEDVEKIADDPIVRQWLVMCLGSHAHAQASGNATSKWLAGVDRFWEKHGEHLMENGFEKDSITEKFRGVCKKVVAECLDLAEDERNNRVWIVKIGDSDKPATKNDMDVTERILTEITKDIKNVRVAVTHHAFDSEVLIIKKPHMLSCE